jgi:hypothetical protein
MSPLQWVPLKCRTSSGVTVVPGIPNTNFDPTISSRVIRASWGSSSGSRGFASGDFKWRAYYFASIIQEIFLPLARKDLQLGLPLTFERSEGKTAVNCLPNGIGPAENVDR